MKIKIAVLTILMLAPAIAFGNPPIGGSEITNEVSAEASSGGNSAENGGTVIKGNAEASVKIKTEVNGEEIQNTEIKIDSEGEVKELKKEETKVSEDGKTTVETKVELKVAGEEKVPDSGEQEEQVSNTDNFVAIIIKTVFENIKNLFSWFIA